MRPRCSRSDITLRTEAGDSVIGNKRARLREPTGSPVEASVIPRTRWCDVGPSVQTRRNRPPGTAVTLGDIASRGFTIVREDDIVYEVIRRIWRKRATMALVARGNGVPRAADIVGVVTKEHVADSVASNVKVYPTWE